MIPSWVTKTPKDRTRRHGIPFSQEHDGIKRHEPQLRHSGHPKWSKNGKIVKEEVDKEVLAWRAVMILYVVGDSPTIGVVSQFIAGQGTFVSKPTIYYPKDGYFCIKSHNISERDRIVHIGPHMINKKPAIVKALESGVQL